MSKLPPNHRATNGDDLDTTPRHSIQCKRHSIAFHDAVSAASRVAPASLTLTVDSLPGGLCGGARYAVALRLLALSPEKPRGRLPASPGAARRGRPSSPAGARRPLDFRPFGACPSTLSTPERLTPCGKTGKKNARLELDARPGFGNCKMESGRTDSSSQLRNALTSAGGRISFF